MEPKFKINPRGINFFNGTPFGTEEDLNSNKNFSSYGDGEWTVFEMSKNFTFNLTLYFFTQTNTVAKVQLNSGANAKDFTPVWDIDTQSGIIGDTAGTAST
jgi:hypothetical protein